MGASSSLFNVCTVLKKHRSLVLPLAIVVGFCLHGALAELKPVVPFLLFFILLLNFSSVEIRKLRITALHLWMLLFQILLSLFGYLAVARFDSLLAQGVLIGALMPVASSVVVISCMLGADRATITTYSMVGNLGIALAAPVFFSFIGQHVDMPFWESVLLILSKIAPTLILPFVLVILMQLFLPKANDWIARYKGVSFYLWAMALMITIGQTIHFIFVSGKGNELQILWLSVVSLLLCVVQFAVGKAMGARFGDRVSGGQGLGQRNTALAIWMAGMYLHPLTTIVPAAYSVWQNLFNSLQLWLHDRREKK